MRKRVLLPVQVIWSRSEVETVTSWTKGPMGGPTEAAALSKTMEPGAALVKLTRLTAALVTWIRPWLVTPSSVRVPAVARMVP